MHHSICQRISYFAGRWNDQGGRHRWGRAGQLWRWTQRFFCAGSQLFSVSEFVTMMTSKWFVKLCCCEKLTTGYRWLVGVVRNQQHKLSFRRKFCQNLPILNLATASPPTSHVGQNLAFFCFLSSCDAIYSSFKSPSWADGIRLGTFVPPKFPNQILENSRSSKIPPNQTPLFVSQTFPVFQLFIF